MIFCYWVVSLVKVMFKFHMSHNFMKTSDELLILIIMQVNDLSVKSAFV